jgi:MSHA biogenesis protein MshG
MARFAWTGHASTGATSGVIDAASANAVADTLLGRGITPLTIEASSASTLPDRQALALPAWRGWFAPRVQPVDLLLFSRQLNTLLRAGVPILRALAGLQESATSLAMKTTLQEVRRSLESGIALSMSLAQQSQVFGSFYVALVRVGEMTGQLDEIFLRLYHHLEFELFMRQQVRSALRYPSFVVSAMVAALAVINIMVIPAFATVFQSAGATLPLATRLLMATSKFTIDFGWLLALGGVAAGLALRRWRATPSGRLRWDELMLRLPVAGRIVRKAMLARFARSLAISLRSGVPIAQALAVVAQTVDNQHIARKVEGMRVSVEHGDSILRAAASAGVFTPVVLQMIAVGEETGAVDQLMDDVAELYSNELKTLSQQLEPILIMFLGVLVLVLALGVFLPVWDLGRTAFKH